jgi:GT2 family glycosyltransferase
MPATVIVPFHRNLDHLARSVTAARRSLPDAEVIVVADGAIEDCGPVAAHARASVLRLPGPSGPAVARNRGARAATGDILVFVDADVAVHDEALPALCAVLERDPAVAAVFGAYDRHPAAPDFLSQFRNLAHAYTHETGAPEAATFWAGLGAVRADAFHAVGGFDERFRRPSVEDIELGYRLVAAGRSIRLDPGIRGTHLKRWTLGQAVLTDIGARGIPWTQLLLQFRTLRRDLNTTLALRASVVLAWLAVLAVAAMPFRPSVGSLAPLALAGLVGLNWPFYRWCARRRGWWFSCRAVTAHTLQHLCNGCSLTIGLGLHAASRIGLDLPGAVPRQRWAAPRPHGAA